MSKLEFPADRPPAVPSDQAQPSPGDATPSPGDATPSPGDATPSPGNATLSPGDATPSPGNATLSPGDARPSPGDRYPLSRGQQAIWFIYKMDPLAAAYNMAGAVRITSDLDAESLGRAFQALVDRHECLRTTFGEARGIPFQRSTCARQPCLSIRDAGDWSDDFLKSEVEQESRRPFDLERGPVFRVTLYRKEPGRHVLLVVVHHIAADFWSLSLLINKLGKLYGGLDESPIRPIRHTLDDGLEDLTRLTAPYSEYVQRERRMMESAAGSEHLSYWRRQLDSAPFLALPLDRERPRFQTYSGGAVGFCISSGLLEKAKSFSSARHQTIFVTLLAVFQLLLSRYSGQDDVVIGTPTGGRASRDFAGTVGYFVNPVVIRSIIGPGESFRDLTGRIKQTVLEAFEHQEYPFTDIVKGLNVPADPSRSPLFQAMFALQKAPLDPAGALAAISLGDPEAVFNAGPLELRGFPIEQRIAQFDITMTIAEYRGRVTAVLEYNAGLFERATIERMGAHYLTLLSDVLTHPLAPVSCLHYTSDTERNQLLAASGECDQDYPEFIPVHRLIQQWASSRPDAVAVVDRDCNLSYGALARNADILAADLREAAGVQPEDPVVLLAERSAEAIVGILAVLKTGGAYVPIDPSTPANRVSIIVDDVRPAAVLAHSSLAHKIARQDLQVIQLDPDLPELQSSPDSKPRQHLEPEPAINEDDVCYIIYTSGSAGAPKGVAVRHLSLAHYIQAASAHYEMCDADRVVQFSSLSFDASADEIYCALVSGGCLVIHRDQPAPSAGELAEFCGEQMITLLSLPTSYWHAMVSGLSQAEWETAPSVRLAVIGGESALPDRMDQWISRTAGRIRLVNSYGPTETTVGVTCWSPSLQGPIGPGSVPIGRPLPGSFIRVLDLHGQLPAAGITGEITIGGAGLARGYLNDPAKTADRFVPDPFVHSIPFGHGVPFGHSVGGRLYRSGDLGRMKSDENFECISRIDNQVKVRGYRIELQEIEAALDRLDAVKESAVVAIDDTRGNKRLAAYAVPSDGANPNPALLKHSLRDSLPPYMVPSLFIFLDKLPRTASGKVDRHSLPAVQPVGEPGRQPQAGLRTGIEQTIAEVWSQVLGIQVIGPNDNFFELGGDSILSLQAAGSARESGIAITPKQIFENPTVAALAAAVGAPAGTAAAIPDPRSKPFTSATPETDSEPLTSIQRWFFECDFEDPHHWNMAVMLTLSDKLDLEVISAALSRLAKLHSVLRSTFTAESGAWRQKPASGLGPIVRQVDVARLPAGERSALIASNAAIEQASLDLANGPLVRSVLFKADAGEPDRLLIVVHHLIADAVSLRILIEDLDRLCAELIEGPSLSADPIAAPATGQLAAPGTGQLAAELERLAAAGRFQNELETWRRLKDASVPRLPVDFAGPSPECTSLTIVTHLDGPRTAELIKAAASLYNAKVDEVLIAALVATLCGWNGGQAALIELERHGREVPGLDLDLDLTRSIGWFTVAFPLLVDLESGSGPSSGTLGMQGAGPCNPVMRVRESLRLVPGGGIGFGVLRHLVRDAETTALMAALPCPQVSFNYLGNLDLSFGALSLFDQVEIMEGGTRSGKAARTHLLEVDAGINRGSLELRWRFSTSIFKRETIERVAQSFAERLSSFIDLSITGKPVSDPAARFELARLSQGELDRLAGSDTTLEDIEDIYPLSPTQQGMLFHAVSSDHEDDYAGTLSISLAGKLDESAFEAAWRQVVQRHSIFRTSFAWQELSEPVQIIHSEAELHFRRLNWSDGWSDDLPGAPRDSLAERLRKLASDERLRGFDVTVAPLMRICLIRISDQQHMLLVSLHHLIIDGWSLPLLFQKVLDSYETILSGKDSLEPRRDASFSSYIRWLREQDRGAAERFWREELQCVTGPPELPIYRAHAQYQSGEGASRRRVTLSASLTARLSSFARSSGLTLNTAVQGGWALLLARYSGEPDVVFGAVTAGRPASLAASNNIIGPFTVTLPVRARISWNQPLGQWLADLQGRQVEARRFDYSSLIDIQGWSDVARGRPLFNSVIAFENYPLGARNMGAPVGLELELIESVESTNYPLTVIAFPGDHLSLEIIYRDGHFDDSAIERMLSHFETLLCGFENNATRPISTIPLLPPAERDEILTDWSGHATEYERDKPIAAILREQVERFPDSVALVCDDRQLSYTGMYRMAAAVAARLAARGIGPEDVVGITTERSIETIVGIAGIVLSGAAYLPVDLSYPPSRVSFILDDAGATLILTSLPPNTVVHDTILHDTALPIASCDRLSLTEILTSDRDFHDAGIFEPGPSRVGLCGPDSLAYVMYTSGSTGVPRGVAITNSGVVRLVRNTTYLDFNPGEIFLQSATLAFDASTFEIWGALLNGARLVMMPVAAPSLAEIGAFIRQHQITTAWFTTGLFHLIARDRAQDLSSVNRVLAGGETMAVQDARALSIHAPECTLIHAYGPTEATTFATTYECGEGACDLPILPIGRPISNTFVYIVDQELDAVPASIPGELCITGDGLARCYAGAPDLTAEKFVPDPFGRQTGQRLYRSGDLAKFLPDGNIEFVGRRDRQVKLRGFRIEPAEIEAMLASHPRIRQCGVLAHSQPPGEKRLVAYLAATQGPRIEIGEVREFLRAKLPDYMVPAEFIVMDSLPLTPNGKIDRRGLPAPEERPRELANVYVEPTSAIEEVLAGVWEETLGRQLVGIRDDFFAIGGHSLAAMRVISSIRYVFKVELPISKIFEFPTIEGLGLALQASESTPGQMERIARVVQRIKRMSPNEKAEKLESRLQQSI